MGTDKRDRQRANRQAKLEQLAKDQRQQVTKRRALRIGLGLAAVVAFVAAIYFVSQAGGDDGEAQATTTVPFASLTTVPVADTVTPADTAAAIDAAAPIDFEYGNGECAEADGSSPKTQSFTEAPALCIDPSKTYTATIESNKGTIELALEAAQYPGAVNNFVNLARFKYYDDTVCHRIIAEFVVQCGRPDGDEEKPGYTIAEEPPQRPYKEGDVVMAKTAAPNSTGGQFFIVTGADGAALPPQYAIVGSITEGLDVATAMEAAANPANDREPLEEISIASITITES